MSLRSNDLLRELLEQVEITNIKDYVDEDDNFRVNVNEGNIDDFISILKEEIVNEFKIKNSKEKLDPGFKQTLLDLMNILLYLIGSINKDDLNNAKNIIEQYGYWAKEKFILQIINEIERM